MELSSEILSKWKNLIDACKSYYVDSVPTGISDEIYDKLELAAAEEGFFVRDFVINTYLKGTKTKNAWIERIKKVKVESSTSMLQTMCELELNKSESLYYTLKYDGSSLAIYLDPTTGKPLRIVTVGNLNLDNYGVDQTWKLIHFLPSRFPKGIVAIQAEALIDTNRMSDDPDRARQKANGLINSKYAEAEVNNLLTLRAFRYYTDESKEGLLLRSGDYRKILYSLGTMKSPLDGHVVFAPSDVWTLDELKQKSTLVPNYTETDRTDTSSGSFLNDGWVVYNKIGTCLGALKYAAAGVSTEVIKTKVQSIQWNSQIHKGKDSWSANVIIDPVVIRGCTIKKPSAGSVNKMITKKVSPGAEVSIILANSTIPMLGEVFKEGNGDFQWPKCSCGYQMSGSNVYGSLLKCGNIDCTERSGRMKNYVQSLSNIINELNLNKLLVIDRFKWETTGISISKLLKYVEQDDGKGYLDYLLEFMKTELQIRNLNLVAKSSFIVLRSKYLDRTNQTNLISF